MIQVENVSQSYGKKKKIEVLKNINLLLKDGEVAALLGHNGSGKSTLIKCLVGVLKPTTGRIAIDGLNVFQHRKKIVPKMGVVFNQKPSFLVDLTVYDNLLYFKTIYHIKENDFSQMLQLVDRYLDIKDLYEKPYRKLSFGERVKCEITSVLLHSPQYIFLDEPTIGLDYNAKKGLYNLLHYLKEETKATILITTHEVDYIEGICDRAIILSHGELEYDGVPKDFSRYLNHKISVTVEFNSIIDETEAKRIWENVESIDMVKKVFTRVCSDEKEKEVYLKQVVNAFSIKTVTTTSASLREVLEDVLDEIKRDK